MNNFKKLALIGSLIINTNVFAKSADELYEEAAALFSTNDLVKGAEAMNRACNAKSDKACLEIGKSYAKGDKLEQDMKKAEQYLQKACDAQLGEGCFELAKLYDALSKDLDADNPQRKEYWAKRQKLRAETCKLNYNRGCQIVKKSQILNTVYNLDKYTTKHIDNAINEEKTPILSSKAANNSEYPLNIIKADGSMADEWDYVEKVDLLGTFGKAEESGISMVMGNAAEKDLHGVVITFQRDFYGHWTCKIDPTKAIAWNAVYMPEQRQLKVICTIGVAK